MFPKKKSSRLQHASTFDHVRAESERSADTGFDGKLTIHPDQIDVVNAAFSPSSKELAEARELLEAAKAQPGAFRFKGQMATW